MRVNRTIVALGLIVLLGAWLRLEGLAAGGLWFDEWITVEQSTRPTLREAVGASTTHPPLLRILTRASIAAFGSERPGGWDVAARLPAALLGIGGIPFIFLFARRFSGGDPLVGLIAAGFYAVGAYGVYHGQEARYYAGMVLFAAWTLHALALVRDVPSSFLRKLYLFAPLALGIHNHHLFGILFVLTVAGVVPIAWRDFPRGLKVLWPWVAAGLAFLPWFIYSMTHLEPQARPWAPDLDVQLRDVPVAFFTGRLGVIHLGGAVKGLPFAEMTARAAWLLLGLGFGLHLLRRRQQLAWLSATIVVTSLILAMGMHDASKSMKIFQAKYLAFIFPFVCLAIGELGAALASPQSWRAIRSHVDAREWRALAFWAGVFIWAGGTAWAVLPQAWEASARLRPGAKRYFHRERYRAAAKWVQQRRGQRSLVVVWDPYRRYNNTELLRYYGLAEPVVMMRWHHPRKPGTFWSRNRHLLSTSRHIYVVTPHAADSRRQAVEGLIAREGFPVLYRRRFDGAEGVVHIAVFALGQQTP